MMLAVIDLIESGSISTNAIHFDDVLLTRYAEYFNIVRSEGDHLNPWMPFFHLKGDRFWHLAPLAERREALESLNSARRRADITNNVDHAFVDDELFGLLMNPSNRASLRDTLMIRWFPEFADSIRELIGVTEYSKMLAGGEKDLGERFTTPVRSAAFRRLVIQAYEYRCAASGWRIILPDYTVLVEAAHIIPFNETADDRPQNGIALTPNFHWALDRHIIAPGPDLKWHVSKSIDDRIPDNRPLIELEGKRLLLPRREEYYPDPVVLEKCVSRLLDE